jgi:hypothetical protein
MGHLFGHQNAGRREPLKVGQFIPTVLAHLDTVAVDGSTFATVTAVQVFVIMQTDGAIHVGLKVWVSSEVQ